MASFLKIISGVYLTAIWLIFFLILMLPGQGILGSILLKLIAALSAIVLSIPAVMIFAFAAIAADTKKIKEHLAVMRRYYEPDRIL